MECKLCKRNSTDEDLFEFHHFEPGSKRRKTDDGVWVCHQCGDQIHLIFTNNELRTQFNNLEFLKSSDKIQKYIKWVSKKPITDHFTVAAKKRKYG